MARGPCPASLILLPLLALGALSVGVELTTTLGLGFDWLLPLILVSVVSVTLGWRTGVAASLILYLASVVAIAGASCQCPTQPAHVAAHLGMAVSSTLSLLPAYAFVIIFSLVMQRQQILRERAEALTEEVSRSKAELEEANARLRQFSLEVEELAIARERNRIAREIHDTLGHYLTILAVQLETAVKLEERGDARLRAELREGRRVVAECLAEVRRSVAALRPADLARSAFDDALRQLVGEFETGAPDVEATLDLEGPVEDLSPELRVTLYRCAQEALTNVRKHAHASKALLRLRVEPASVELTVLDNGAPVADAGDARAPGFGLLGIRERVALLGGTVTAGPQRERGWRVEVSVPREAAPNGYASAVRVAEDREWAR
jgi:signal transduction histidine kinase